MRTPIRFDLLRTARCTATAKALGGDGNSIRIICRDTAIIITEIWDRDHKWSCNRTPAELANSANRPLTPARALHYPAEVQVLARNRSSTLCHFQQGRFPSISCPIRACGQEGRQRWGKYPAGTGWQMVRSCSEIDGARTALAEFCNTECSSHRKSSHCAIVAHDLCARICHHGVSGSPQRSDVALLRQPCELHAAAEDA